MSSIHRETNCVGQRQLTGDKSIKALIHILKIFNWRHRAIIATVTKETCTNAKSTKVTQLPREIPY